MSAPVARLAGVTHRYGKALALDGIGLDIPAGVMAGLVGPDGVGKSTLLGLLAGVKKPQAGEIEVLGGSVLARAHLTGLRRRIAYMPQGLGRNLYPTLSVAENLAYFGRLAGQGAAERAQRIEALLAATGLAPFPGRPAGKLSGGMKQKLSLCCALIGDPELLILDEPTTGVDPLSRRQFWTLIERLRARRPGMSVLVATAYMEEAERFDWLAALDDGRLVAAGAPAALMARTGAGSLEEAFIRLLPEEKRAEHEPLALPSPPPAPDGAPPVIEAPVIEAWGLTKRFGGFTAVDHVDLSIPRGEIFGFLGSNGCGKTTTMKMLTGLLAPDEGTASILGRAPGEGGPMARQDVAYMSQSFSLYTELTVRQNLELHAGLFGLRGGQAQARVSAVLADFDLVEVAAAAPESLPLGLRQRLQLAAAVVHHPKLLILDEPTSGVDPVARDLFWRHILRLSREEGVTIFVSTHFMNEAARCDRISLMHAGRVLAVGTPAALAARDGAGSLEAAFIHHLEQASGEAGEAEAAEMPPLSPAPPPRPFEARRLLAGAWRESLELLRDKVRLAFALLGPILLMLAFGFGISFDVERLPYAVLDQDRTPDSRALIEGFQGSRYFNERAPPASAAEMQARLRRGEIVLGIEIPAGFGEDLRRGRRPEVLALIDGAMPFRAETVRGYAASIASEWAARRVSQASAPRPPPGLVIETRFLFNQAFLSAYAIIPGVIMLMLALIPAIMAAIGVVREKESGAIANFRATAVTAPEFLIGKQLPYLATGMLSFLVLALMARFVFAVPIKGSGLALGLGALLYVAASTGFGLLVSAFTRTQVAALFATAILSVLPAVNFSGLLVPVSAMSPGARVLGLIFPAAWFQQIAVGTMTKAQDLAELWLNHLALGGFCLALLGAACFCLPKQEA